ncbi:1-acyl-sn-glycerol-3-phosphate acyltransferase [mine drainage metagenome]|uniref:1-acyl-sn-glycerol-3-phosphate acyltransferase n=1 Tax=mine drainage metagenome TaxID=410659 RepID=A0A1J5QLA4_9ZZZZ
MKNPVAQPDPIPKAALNNPAAHPLISSLRLLRLLLHVSQGVLTAAILLPRLSHAQRQQRIQRWSAKTIAILNVRVAVYGQLPPATRHSMLFIANHISWIDIWAILQVQPVSFVAKSEVRNWPVIGWLAQKTGTLFIERTRRQDTGRAASSMEQELRAGKCLCLFPEGTTTNGTELRPFKTGLLQSAINAEVMVSPIAIRYPNPDGSTNTVIAYYGDVTMMQSLHAILRQREIMVELHFLPPVPALGQERRQLSSQARDAISSLLHLPEHKAPETPAGLPAAAP